MDIDTRLTDSQYSTSGTCIIEGKIRNSEVLSSQDSITLIRMPLNPQMKNHPYTRIEQDGKFQITANLDASSWTYLVYKEKYVPVFLLPSDTLEVDMDSLFTLNERISYKSKKNLNIMKNLLEGDPIFASWDLAYSKAHQTRPSIMMEKAKNSEEEYARMAKYIAWKYHMNAEEAHLLYSMMHSNIDDYLLSCASSTLQALLPLDEIKNMPEQEIYKIIREEKLDDYLSFMEMIDINDYAHLLVPYRFVISSVKNNYMWTIATLCNQSYKDFLESHTKQTLNKEWIERIE